MYIDWEVYAHYRICINLIRLCILTEKCMHTTGSVLLDSPMYFDWEVYAHYRICINLICLCILTEKCMHTTGSVLLDSPMYFDWEVYAHYRICINLICLCILTEKCMHTTGSVLTWFAYVMERFCSVFLVVASTKFSFRCNHSPHRAVLIQVHGNFPTTPILFPPLALACAALVVLKLLDLTHIMPPKFYI